MSNQNIAPLELFLQELEIILETQPKTLSPKEKKSSEKLPWDDAHPRVKIPFQARLPERLYKKIKWVQKNTVGGQSMQDLLLTSLELYVEKRITEIEEDYSNRSHRTAKDAV